jgi:signal transduction histidine kinase
VVDATAAAALFAITATELAGRSLQQGQRPSDAVAYLLAFAMAAPYAVHRRVPMAALAVSLAALLAYAFGHYSAFPGLNAFALLFGVSLHSDRRRALVAFVGTAGAITAAIALQPAGIADSSTWLSSELATAVCWLGARNLRQRRARWAAMAERTRELERGREERARQAVVAERLRIARELHDVVAHSMSVIAVQSGVGRHVIEADPAEARRALESIETTSRSALVELRRMLGVLRQEGETGGELAPAPGLADVAALAEQVTQAGVDVTLDVSGPDAGVPAGVGLSAFRIVQEALTNVIKHGGPRARVTIVCGGEDVCVEVVDPGSARPRPGADTAGASRSGILGMRERVALFGGEISAAPRPGGGFRVAARLPFAASPPGAPR